MAEAAPPRRGFLVRLAAAARVAPLALGVIEGRALAASRDEGTDVAILHGALALENQALALYDLGLRRGLFPTGLRSYAVEFRGDHLGHRDTQVALSRERGAEPPEPLADYGIGSLPAGDGMVRAALEAEQAAQAAYASLISQIRSRDYLLSAGFILVDEVRHMTVWRRVLGLKIY